MTGFLVAAGIAVGSAAAYIALVLIGLAIEGVYIRRNR